jgi:hypothetical protein
LLYILLRSKVRQNRITAAEAAADWLSATFLMKGIQIKLICGPTPNLTLHNGEEVLCIFPETILTEPRAIRTSRGAYAGPSFRIAKGVSFRFGGYRGTSESHEELRPIDRGTLALTNQRLVFEGSGRTISTRLEDIIEIEAYLDGLRLRRERKQRVEYFQLSSGLEMTYPRDGKNVSAPVQGRMIKAAIEQARVFRRHGQGIRQPLDC